MFGTKQVGRRDFLKLTGAASASALLLPAMATPALSLLAPQQAQASSVSSAAMITLPSLHKRAGNYSTNEYETSLLVYEGELLTIAFLRDITRFTGLGIRVRRFFSGALLAENSWPGSMGSVMVINGEIHIFGTTNDATYGNSVIHSVLDRDFKPSTPRRLMTTGSAWTVEKGGNTFWNTEITRVLDGYILVVETQADGDVFFKSSDLINWAPVGRSFNRNPTTYAGCPTIDFYRGTFYLTYLADGGDGHYFTRIARSTDLVDWERFKGNATLGPEVCVVTTDPDGISASDLSYAEYDGKTYCTYMVSDQTSWAVSRTGVYLGRIPDLYREFFP